MGTFVFDIVGTLPGFLSGEYYTYYWYKIFRSVIHIFCITEPLEMIMKYLLRKYSKKRQNDLTSFGALIVIVIYVAHITGCLFLNLGFQYPCKINANEVQDGDENLSEDCTLSWIYANDFEE